MTAPPNSASDLARRRAASLPVGETGRRETRPASGQSRDPLCARGAEQVWWIYGARHGGEHPFAAETRALLKALSRSHSHIRYSSPRPGDRLAVDFDAPGRLDMHAIEELGVPRDADFYLCGPAAFMNDLAVELGTWGVAANRVHTEIFGSSPPRTPGIAAAPRRPPHQPAGSAGVGPLVSFARSGLNVRWAPALAAFHLSSDEGAATQWINPRPYRHPAEATMAN